MMEQTEFAFYRALTSDRERCECLLYYTYSSILFVFTSLSLIFLTKNHKYCRLSLWSCDSLQLFLYLCSQNLTNL